jgi:hypothetical protein
VENSVPAATLRNVGIDGRDGSSMIQPEASAQSRLARLAGSQPRGRWAPKPPRWIDTDPAMRNGALGRTPNPTPSQKRAHKSAWTIGHTLFAALSFKGGPHHETRSPCPRRVARERTRRRRRSRTAVGGCCCSSRMNPCDPVSDVAEAAALEWAGFGREGRRAGLAASAPTGLDWRTHRLPLASSQPSTPDLLRHLLAGYGQPVGLRLLRIAHRGCF